MTTYLSIDVATKSLAIGLYNIDKNHTDLDMIINPIAMNVYDLDPSKSAKNMTVDDKARALKLVLTEFDTHIPDVQFIVLIEYQMNANHMSNVIFNMIVYHYAGRAPIHTVFPSLKNSIYLHRSLKLSDFLATATNNYSANKNHCKYNFLYFIILFGHGDRIKHIKQKNIDDISDTFMQCLAYHRKAQ
jgi:hypothetical protein